MNQIDEYIDLVYNWKSKLANMPLSERKVLAAKKIGIDIPQCKERTILYLQKQSHHRFTLLVSREELLEEMLKSLSTGVEVKKGDDKELKTIKLKGEIEQLCGRLVEEIEEGYRTIWGELSEEAKVEVKKAATPEERIQSRK